jgi:hypothetical protein
MNDKDVMNYFVLLFYPLLLQHPHIINYIIYHFHAVQTYQYGGMFTATRYLLLLLPLSKLGQYYAKNIEYGITIHHPFEGDVRNNTVPITFSILQKSIYYSPATQDSIHSLDIDQEKRLLHLLSQKQHEMIESASIFSKLLYSNDYPFQYDQLKSFDFKYYLENPHFKHYLAKIDGIINHSHSTTDPKIIPDDLLTMIYALHGKFSVLLHKETKLIEKLYPYYEKLKGLYENYNANIILFAFFEMKLKYNSLEYQNEDGLSIYYDRSVSLNFHQMTPFKFLVEKSFKELFLQFYWLAPLYLEYDSDNKLYIKSRKHAKKDSAFMSSSLN